MQINGSFLPSNATLYRSAAAEEQKQLAPGPGILYGLMVSNFNAAARWVYLFDSLTATGTPLFPPIPLQLSGAAGSQAVIWMPAAVPFTTGLFIASSSTGPTFTAAGSNDLRLSAWLDI